MYQQIGYHRRAESVFVKTRILKFDFLLNFHHVISQYGRCRGFTFFFFKLYLRLRVTEIEVKFVISIVLISYGEPRFNVFL